MFVWLVVHVLLSHDIDQQKLNKEYKSHVKHFKWALHQYISMYYKESPKLYKIFGIKKKSSLLNFCFWIGYLNCIALLNYEFG